MEFVMGVGFVMGIVGALKILYEKYFEDKLPKAAIVGFVAVASLLLCMCFVEGEIKERFAYGLVVWLSTMGVYSAGKSIKRENIG